jgi:hypothetical protein
MREYSLTRWDRLGQKSELLASARVAPAIVLDRADNFRLAGAGQMQKAKSLAAHCGSPLAVHLPFRGLDPIAEDRAIARYSRMALSRSCEWVCRHSPGLVIVHSFLPATLFGVEARGAVEELIPILSELRACASASGAVLAVENSFDRDKGAFELLVRGAGARVILDLPRIGTVVGAAHPPAWIEDMRELLLGLHAYASSGEDLHEAIELPLAEALRLGLSRLPADPESCVLYDVPRDALVPSLAALRQWCSSGTRASALAARS